MLRPIPVLAALCLAACGGGAPPPPVAPPPPPPAPSPPPPAPDPEAALAAKIDPIFAAYATGRTPGCAVGVYREGQVLFARGYGYADLEHDVRNTDTTAFYLASVSKQFTAAAVLLLAKEGRLRLEDDVRKYVPELPDYKKTIRLEHLLHHTSGIRDYGLLIALEGRDDADSLTNDDILWLLAHQRGLNFPPGTRYLYSNSGYLLLAVVVERVTGKPFSAFAKESIFDPLRMSDSRIKQDHQALIPRRAMGYVRRPDGTFGTFMSDSEYTGPGNVVTTIRDLARWDENFYAPKIGGQPLLDGLRTHGKLEDGTVLDYTMGLEIGRSLGRPSETHDGAFVGYRTSLTRYPEDRLTVAVLCNDASAQPGELSEKVAAVFLPAAAAPARAEAPPPPPASLGIDPAEVTGAYRDPATQEIRFLSLDHGVIHLHFALAGGPPPRELVPVGPRELLVKDGDTRYTFEPASGKRPAHLVRRPAHARADTFERFEPLLAVPPEKVADYAGRYASDEIPRDVQFVARDGKLLAASWGAAPIPEPLQPLLADVFVLGGLTITFERDARGKVKAMVVDEQRAHGVRFMKR